MGRTLLEHYSEEVVHIPGFKMQKLVTNQHNKGKIVLIILMFIIAKHTLTGALLYFCRKAAGEKKMFQRNFKDAADHNPFVLVSSFFS